MQSVQHLAKLRDVAGHRVRRLRGRALAAVNLVGPSFEKDRDIAFVVIELQNLWGNFVRAYLLSLLRSPKRALNGRVSLGNAAITTPGDLLHLAARSTLGATARAPVGRRDEPAWHDVSVLVKTCNALKPSHEAHVYASMSLSGRAFYDLPAFRNFYAHRNDESAGKALGLARRQYLITGIKHPTEALCVPARRRPQALILDWTDEIDATIQLLCD